MFIIGFIYDVVSTVWLPCGPPTSRSQRVHNRPAVLKRRVCTGGPNLRVGSISWNIIQAQSQDAQAEGGGAAQSQPLPFVGPPRHFYLTSLVCCSFSLSK